MGHRAAPFSARSRHTRTSALGGSLALALALLLAACGSSGAASAAGQSRAPSSTRSPATQVVLTNQKGQHVTLAGLHGKVVVLAPS